MSRKGLALTVVVALGLALLVPLSSVFGQAAPSWPGGCRAGAPCSAGSVSSSGDIVSGTLVSAPILDAGVAIINAGTLNNTGAVVLSNNLTADIGKTHLGNLHLDGGSKLCLGDTIACPINIARSNANTLAITADTATTFSGAVQTGGGGIYTVPVGITPYYQTKVADGANAIGFKFASTNALTTAGARTHVFYRDEGSTEILSVYGTGTLKPMVGRSANLDWSTGDAGVSTLSVGGPGTENALSVSTGGIITRYGDVATEGYGIPVTQDYGTVSASSTDDVTVATITAPAVDTIYEVGGNVDVTAYTSGQIGFVMTYTSCAGNVYTNKNMNAYITATDATGLVCTAACANTSVMLYPVTFCLNASATATLKTQNSAAAATGNFYGYIRKIAP